MSIITRVIVANGIHDYYSYASNVLFLLCVMGKLYSTSVRNRRGPQLEDGIRSVRDGVPHTQQ